MLHGYLTGNLLCCLAMFQERHWTSPAMASALQAVINSPLSNRLKEALKIAPRLLDSYFPLAVHDANDCTCIDCFSLLDLVEDLYDEAVSTSGQIDFLGL